MSDSLLKTPLAARHESLGAKMVPFAGWHMPVSFTGIQLEHHLVRQAVGLFDASHMGLIRILGSQAKEFINRMAVNDASRLADFQSHYSALCKVDGTCIDDIYTVRMNEQEWYLVVNAGTKQKDLQWLRAHAPADMPLEMLDTGLLSLQGPLSKNVMDKMFGAAPGELAKNGACWVSFAGEQVLVTRTGYTGEDGFELFPTSQNLLAMHDALLEQGKEWGIQSCGLGCRDTLRLESGFSLYGHELNETMDLVSAGLSWIVGWDKSDFIGKAALLKCKQAGVARKLVGLLAIDKCIPRDGMSVEMEGQSVGQITSGGMSPVLNQGIALAYVDLAYAKNGQEVFVKVRDQLKKFRVQARRFVGGK